MSGEQQLRTQRAVSLNRAIEEHPDTRLFPWQPNLIDWRHSLVIADKRADQDDETLEICAHCGCEVDITPQPHKPGCKGIGAPRVSPAADAGLEKFLDSVEVLEEAAANALGPDAAASSNTETGPAGPPRLQDDDAPRAPEAAPPHPGATGGASNTRKTYVKWTPELAVERVRELAEELGRPPAVRDLVKHGLSSLQATPTLQRLGFGTWVALRDEAMARMRAPSSEGHADVEHRPSPDAATRTRPGVPDTERAVSLRDALSLLVHATRQTLDALERELHVEGDLGQVARVVVRHLGDDT